MISLHLSADKRRRLRIRIDGSPGSDLEFVPINNTTCTEPIWSRVVAASRRLASELQQGPGFVARVQAQRWNAAHEYLLAFTEALESGARELALQGTIEAQTLGGRTIGLIVLPMHPLRLAWHAGFDYLAAHSRYEQAVKPGAVKEALAKLDGALMPAFLPGLAPALCACN
jgi:DNA phosphorothioation-dependent restriction protein DptH